jgi:hypothetical protein
MPQTIIESSCQPAGFPPGNPAHPGRTGRSAVQLGYGFFTDRAKLVHQALKHGGQFRIAGCQHQQLEPRTRPFWFDGGTHGLHGQLRQQ